jgi:hypothetical protein
MAMEALGRVMNVAATVGGASAANAAAIALRDTTGITFVCYGADTYTLTVSSTFAGSYASPGTIINHYYKNTAANGTTSWTRVSQSAADNVVLSGAGAVAVIEVLNTMLADPNAYIKCTVTGTTGIVTAITHDLAVQRTPANLPKMSA